MRLAIVMLALLGLPACGPLVMIPGGELSGEVQNVPSDWSFSDAVKTVQLETRPADPHSVNIYGVAVGRDFYVAASKPDNQWARNIADDENVRLRIGKTIYELRAVRDDSPEGRERFVAALKQKYDYEPEEGEAYEPVLFRLVAH
jgi:hypothetical protein